MRKIANPQIDQEELYDSCTASVCPIQNETRRKRIVSNKEKILIETKDFEYLYKTGKIVDFESEIITKSDEEEDMIFLYEKKLVSGNKQNRKYYEKILYGDSITNNCPFCEFESVQTLDHFIPKKKYPVFAITPENLVAMCSKCNQKKKEYTAETVEKLLLHPYFIEESIKCLKVIYLADEKKVRFILNDNFSDKEMEKRIKNHVEIFDLIERVNLISATIIERVKNLLRNMLLVSGDVNSLKEIALNCFKVMKVNNILEEAVIEELLNNDLFLENLLEEL